MLFTRSTESFIRNYAHPDYLKFSRGLDLTSSRDGTGGTEMVRINVRGVVIHNMKKEDYLRVARMPSERLQLSSVGSISKFALYHWLRDRNLFPTNA